MRRRLIPINVIIVAGLLVLLSLGPDQSKPPRDVMERGRAVYDAECSGCHRQDGLGTPQLNPPLVKTKWVLGPKHKLIQIILNGAAGPIEVDGDTYHDPMLPNRYLSDQQVADVLTYVRNSFENKAIAVTPAEVKKVRSALAKKAKKK
ncbi:MAG: cytochrome c [Chitinophagaceae bacterium]|nr:cytochrome c [Chitinophagaceae bacterium]